MARLREVYKAKIVSEMMKQFNYKNVNQVPKLEKIVINCVSRDCVVNGKVVEKISSDLSLIAGQKAVSSYARKSIATFKLREGQAIGAHVTLRGIKMYEFLDRLINFAMPRVKDFQGINSKGMDGRGNFSMGIKEQIIFPEIDYDKIDKVRGLGISFQTTAKNNEEGRFLLKAFGLPLKEL